MNDGLPPKPTLRHMIAGIALCVILVLAFLELPVVTKYIGAALTFIPSHLGLFQVVSHSEVMPVDIRSTPTSLIFTKPGPYLLYTDDLSLLEVNDAILASHSRPWIYIQSESGEPVQVRLIERGLAIYDTPLAGGRPVVSFEIITPGVFIMEHPVRQIDVYIVPDYLSGKEGTIIYFICLEIAVVVLAIWYFVRRRRAEMNRRIRLLQRP